jgi:hypothetical protein
MLWSGRTDNEPQRRGPTDRARLRSSETGLTRIAHTSRRPWSCHPGSPVRAAVPARPSAETRRRHHPRATHGVVERTVQHHGADVLRVHVRVDVPDQRAVREAEEVELLIAERDCACVVGNCVGLAARDGGGAPADSAWFEADQVEPVTHALPQLGGAEPHNLGAGPTWTARVENQRPQSLGRVGRAVVAGQREVDPGAVRMPSVQWNVECRAFRAIGETRARLPVDRGDQACGCWRGHGEARSTATTAAVRFLVTWLIFVTAYSCCRQTCRG